MDMEKVRVRRPFNLDRTVRLVITVVIIVVSIFLINYLRSVLLPFIVACVAAYIIHPFVRFNKRIFRLKGNVLAVFLTLIEIVGVLTLFGYFFFPYLVDEISTMIEMLSRYTKSLTAGNYLSPAISEYISKHLDFNSISKMFSHEEIISFVENAVAELWSIMGSSISVLLSVVSWLIVLLYLIFILIDYDEIMHGFKSMIPKKYNKSAMTVLRDIEMTMNRYFRGQALVSLLVGIIFSIGFLIMGLPLAVVFGLFIGVLNMVPYLQLISLPIAALLCGVMSVNTGQNFWILFGEAFAVYCVCQLIQDMLLTPKIMGKFMGLNPAIIFLSLSVWGTLLGFIGFIIALPLTTLVISYYKQYVIGGDAEEVQQAEKSNIKKPEITEP